MSATDTLCAMLADRCEEFFVNDFGVNWRYYSDPHTATESMDGTLIVTGLTPMQAVVATLGSGGLTAEQVQELMESNSHQYQSLTDPYVYLTEYDWHAIADELNAMMGAGTCKADETDLIPFVRATGDVSKVDYIRVMECSSCGGTFEHVNGSYEFCPRCGRRIEVGE